jgi:hypothetical protein
VISHVEPGGADASVDYFHEDGTLKKWAELTDDEQDCVVYHTALAFLDDPGMQQYTAARLREETDPFWDRIAAAMDAETAARAVRGTLRVARSGR